MPSPVIGITTNYGKNPDGLPSVYLLRAYVRAIQEAGGLPILLPSDLADSEWEIVYARLDGILFSGGGDIALEHFDGSPHPRVCEVDPMRDALELALARRAAGEGKPFLGICRGCQLINVALGGTLFTHLYDQLPGALDHAYPGNMRQVLVHPVQLKPDGRLAHIVGTDRLMVNSLHHQGLKDLAPGILPLAWAPDGLVEAVEYPGHPFGLAVQWHPEWLTDQQETRRLFKAFIDAALESPR